MNGIIQGMLWAAAAIFPAALGGFSVIYYMVSRDLSVPLAAMSAGVIRMLLVAAAGAIILNFTNAPMGWFVAWLVLFYIITLVAEVYYAIGAVSRRKK